MDREFALSELKKRVTNKNLLKHMYAAEAIMRALAQKFNEDPERWGIAGLVHDIDYEETAESPSNHSIVGYEMLKELGFDEDIAYAVKVHNDYHGLERKSLIDKALYATDPITGLIVAGALINPAKKLDAIDKNFILKRFNEKSFAKGASREKIKACSELGMNLEEFIDLSLNAMKGISGPLEL